MKFDTIRTINNLNQNKIYFASDFHLGLPDHEKSRTRELKINRWLDSIKDDAHSIYFLGDIFDFWFEYKHTIPKGYIRFLGKIAELVDNGTEIIFFLGNHDMWMFDYFQKEINVAIHKNPKIIIVENKKLLIGHGDGLGPGDYWYKLLKIVFESKLSHWLFERIHPNTGVMLAKMWSQKSRLHKKNPIQFLGDKEYLWTYAKNIEKIEHHDYYIFGHRHLPLCLDVENTSKYINLGEWIKHCTYGVFDGKKFELLTFEENTKHS